MSSAADSVGTAWDDAQDALRASTIGWIGRYLSELTWDGSVEDNKLRAKIFAVSDVAGIEMYALLYAGASLLSRTHADLTTSSPTLPSTSPTIVCA